MKDYGFPLSRPACIFLWAHDSSLTRRLAWRFENQGLRVENRRIDVARQEFGETLHHENSAHVVDLGWTDPQIEAAMALVFSMTDPGRTNFDSMPVYVLAPWFDTSTRPAWAELGVRLVLDRTSPPPEIAKRVMNWSTVD
ncbi:hypothetical protein GC170_18380 [bacterium]|nr:hypothetical protein [bacterium]